MEAPKSDAEPAENDAASGSITGESENAGTSSISPLKMNFFGALADGNQTTLTAEESEQRQHAVDDLKRKISRGISPNKDGDLPPTDEAKKIMESFTEEKSLTSQ